MGEYLWQAYDESPDTKFNKYMVTKKDLYDEGERTFTPRQIMKIALDKAVIMKDKGEWLKSPPKGEKFIGKGSRRPTSSSRGASRRRKRVP
jgi:hypothetical protein